MNVTQRDDRALKFAAVMAITTITGSLIGTNWIETWLALSPLLWLTVAHIVLNIGFIFAGTRALTVRPHETRIKGVRIGVLAASLNLVPLLPYIDMLPEWWRLMLIGVGIVLSAISAVMLLLSSAPLFASRRPRT